MLKGKDARNNWEGTKVIYTKLLITIKTITSTCMYLQTESQEGYKIATYNYLWDVDQGKHSTTELHQPQSLIS